jgi:hypothetical protein
MKIYEFCHCLPHYGLISKNKMIYLTFDTNIWIYLLDESWKEDNMLDYLEHWIEEDLVQILLPEIILTEWERHKLKEKKERMKTLRKFFAMAEEILPTSFFRDYKKPDQLDRIIENQFNRIENILRSNPQLIQISQEVKNAAIERSINKTAPMHTGKNSVADTLIVLSLFEFIEKNLTDEYLFLSENVKDFFEVGQNAYPKGSEIVDSWNMTKEDFKTHSPSFDAIIKETFEKKYNLHSDLKLDFERLKIKEFRHLQTLVSYLKSKIPLSIDIESKRIDRIKNKIRQIIYNPEYENLIASLPKSNFIDKAHHVEQILMKAIPTQEEATFVIAIIDDDEKARTFFYKRVWSPSWFNILKEKGEFSSDRNFGPIEVDKGFTIGFWEPLEYLEKISIQIRQGKSLNLIGDLIEIIRSISENPKDNYTTWNFIIKILINIPNDRIPIDILHFIPVWLDSRFDTMLQSFSITDGLLPKFLLAEPTADDVAKLEIILNHLFTVHEKNDSKFGVHSEDTAQYKSRLYTSSLETGLLQNQAISKISALCAPGILLELASNLNKLLFNFHDDALKFSINSKGEDFECNFKIGDDLLYGKVFQKGQIGHDEKVFSVQLFPEMTEKELSRNLTYQLEKQKVYYEAGSGITGFELMASRVLYGTYFPFSSSIANLQNHTHDGEEAVLAVIFRDLLNEFFIQRPKEGLNILWSICSDGRFRHPFFRKVILFIVGEHWMTAKSVFLEMTRETDKRGVFSIYNYEEELYSLLIKNQSFFDKSDLLILQKIIEGGPINRDSTEFDHHWKLKWYSALRDTEPFKQSYETLSCSLNQTHEDFERPKNEVFWSGPSSAYTIDELLKMDNREIAAYLLNFKPKDSWEQPSIAGFSVTLGAAVIESPEKFSEDLNCYLGAPYIYVYRILNGFREAWNRFKPFDWKNVLAFCKSYLLDKRFYAEQLSSDTDTWHASSDWVVGAIAELLSGGMQSDRNAFDFQLLPAVKELIQILISNLAISDGFDRANSDYIGYSINSPAGKVLKAMIDYSLRRARNQPQDDDSPRWENEPKNWYDRVIDKGIIDGYVHLGLYFHQLYYLDKEWLIAKIETIKNSLGGEWIPFMTGYSFRNPSHNKDVYILFRGLYEKAIKENKTSGIEQGKGIIGHIVTFYLWEWENLDEDGLLKLFIDLATPPDLSNLITFVWQQNEYVKTLDSDQLVVFESRILFLWERIIKKYEDSTVESEIKVVQHSSNLFEFISELNEYNTSLLSKCLKTLGNHFSPRHLFKNLLNLHGRGEQIATSRFVARIISLIPLGTYFSTNDKPIVIELLAKLYENDQKVIADDFCNRFVKQGQDFLKEVYLKYQTD